MGEIWTVLGALTWTASYFRDKGIESPRLEAELLLADLLDLDRVGLYLNFDRPLNEEERTAFRDRVGRRSRREPTQYILGRTEFWSLPFKVTPAVLIPRPDTEILVEEALKLSRSGGSILDVGTGSGAVAVAVAKELPTATVVGIDLSPEALAIARENAGENGVGDRIEFRQGDLRNLPKTRFDLIVANPPYVKTGDFGQLMPEVRDYEPVLALDGGPDGLDALRALADQAPELLNPGGWLLLEVGEGQAEPVQGLLNNAGMEDIFMRNDLGGIPRVVGGRWTGARQEGPLG